VPARRGILVVWCDDRYRADMTRRWWVAGSAVAAVGLVSVLVACTSQAANTQQQPKVPAFASPAPHTTSAAPAEPPKACSDIAAATDVDTVVGHQLPGSMSQVIGVPQPKIGRTGRLDCYYGIPAGKRETAGVLSIGIGSYTDESTAQHRTTLTVNNARNAGATTSAVRVGDEPAVLIAGPKTQELVLSRGNITFLISANNGVLTAGKIGPQLIQLGQRALNAHS
jgi:hypothetical protein